MATTAFGRCFVLIFLLSTASVSARAGPLHDAAAGGDLDAVRTLIGQVKDIDEPDDSGKSALYIAAENDHAAIVTFLAENTADPDKFIVSAYTGQSAPIHAAVRSGSTSAVRALAEAEADLFLQSYQFGTPIHAAVETGNEDMVALLKSLGAGKFSANDIDELISDADPEFGRRVAGICNPCHALEAGGEPTRPQSEVTGPSLVNIVGRPIASEEAYEYSQAMRSMEGVWDYSSLNHFIASPTAYVPGTKMLVTGIGRDEARAAIIAFLWSLTDDPPPLPQ